MATTGEIAVFEDLLPGAEHFVHTGGRACDGYHQASDITTEYRVPRACRDVRHALNSGSGNCELFGK